MNCATTLAALVIATSLPASAQKAPLPGDACKLLTDAEVRRVFTDAKAGARETSLEKYGIASCVWMDAGGRLVVNLVDEFAQIDVEARQLAEGMVDPLKPESVRNVRMIRFAGVGDAAIGFVEAKSDAKGILAPIAVLVVQRGPRQLTLYTHQLALRERASAQAALANLGRAAAERM